MKKPVILDASGKAHMSREQQEIVDMLEQTLAQAKSGAIKTVGIIACFEDGFASVAAGNMATALNLGCDDLKRKILDATAGAGAARMARGGLS